MRIGIVGDVDSNDRFGVNANYVEFAAIAGSPTILSPDFDPASVDGIILPGGPDVLSSRYGIPGFWTGNPSQFLEYFDRKYLPDLLGKMPIFGICRGLQTINVTLGGTLHQHLWFHPQSVSDTDQAHSVVLKEGQKMKVNSFHHQAINKLGSGIAVEATSVGDKYVEAISGKLFFAVQWHPERLMDSYSEKKIISLFG